MVGDSPQFGGGDASQYSGGGSYGPRGGAPFGYGYGTGYGTSDPFGFGGPGFQFRSYPQRPPEPLPTAMRKFHCSLDELES
eukprot:4979466-Prymnesium_polylepis.1